MPEYTNPCDLCKHRYDCTDDCALNVYSSARLEIYAAEHWRSFEWMNEKN